MNGPKAIYSIKSLCLIFWIINRAILNKAAIKNDIIDIAIIPCTPKYKPNAAIILTSPNPIVSLPNINPPIIVIAKNISPPTINPWNILNATFKLNIPCINVKINPTSNIVKVNLFGIICIL